MIGFARFTAIIFILLGLALVIGGVVIALGGFVGMPVPVSSAPGLMPNLSGWFALAGTIAGAVVSFQGLLLAALGQVLWLMAGIVDKNQTSIEYLEELVNRMGNAIRAQR